MQQSIRLGGTDHPISFGMAALYAYEQWRGHSVLSKFAELTDGNPSISLIVDIAYVGLKEGARKEGHHFKLQPTDVADLINLDPVAIAAIMECFAASFPKADIPEPGVEEKGPN